MNRLPIAAVGFLVVLAGSLPAGAQDARTLFREGLERYEAGDFRGALERFERGYELEREPAFLYNIGRCREELGEVHPAIDAYEQYLSESPQGEDAQDVQARITRLQEQVRREEGEPAAPLHAPEEPSEPADPEAPPGPRGTHQVGGGLAVLSPRQNPLILRFEGEYRLELTPGWRLVGDVSYIQIGESGDSLSEDGFGLAAGALREWALGEPESASFFPHARLQLVFERTSTRHATSSIFLAARGGPGIDWRVVPHGSLSLDLELGLGLLSISGSTGDSAVVDLTIGGALRLMFDFG